MRVWIPGLVVAGLLSHAASAQSLRDRLAIEGKQVPLPPGEWRLAGQATSTTPSLASVALLRLHGTRVDAAILVQASPRHQRPGWGTPETCRRTDLILARIRHASDHDGSCAWAAYVTPGGRGLDPAWTMAARAAVDQGWRLPAAWVEAAYRVTDTRGAIQVRYLFDPHGGTGPRPLDAVAKRALAGWIEAVWDPIEDGFRNGLDTAIPDWPPDWPPDETAPPPAGPPATPASGGWIGHLGVKTITYRLFGTLTDLSVNYLWLGSLPSASGLAVVGGVASSTLYFVHELVWSRFETPAATAVALPGIGTEGPFPATR